MECRTGILPVEVKKKKTRRSKRQSYKKYSNFASNENKWTIFHTNIRGYNSKKKSFLSIINGVNPNVITINELGYKKDKKLKIPGYHCYNRNRVSENMGGVATAIKNDEIDHAVKTDEGSEKDEFIITRHSQFNPPINVINCYGEIESRTSNKIVEDRWQRLLEKITRIEASNESVILIGDLNKLVGNGEFGVKDNHEKISFGGKLIHQLLSGGKYVLVNNTEKCVGGPFTRVDPADPSIMSCLDLVLISTVLYDFIVTLKIDKEKIMTPHRSVGKNKKLVYTDHFTLLLMFKNIPINPKRKSIVEKQTVWNTNKPAGWDTYKELTDDNDDLENLAMEVITDTTEFNQKLDKIMNKIKFRSFGKVSFTNKSQIDKPLENLYEEKRINSVSKVSDEKIIEVEMKISDLLLKKQRIEYEKKLDNLKTLKNTKGKSAAVFNLKARVLGEKKVRQEAAAVEDPVTKELIYDAENIKATALEYLSNLLKNRKPKEGYEKDLKVVNILHERRMAEDTEEDNDLTKDDFCDLMKKLKKNNKNKYKFILQAGASFHKCLFKLFKMTWESEIKPAKWENTIAHQLYKGKGEKAKLSNQRFIHTKDENPKAFEHIIISKSKQKIVEGCSKYQIGAIPKHQSQEHLFTLKSIMEWYETLKIPLILQLYDISKFFDRENLQDGMA